MTNLSDSKFPKDFLFRNYPPSTLDIPSELTARHNPYSLGNEPGYRRLSDGEIVQEGDETFGIFGQPWTTASKWQIGNEAKTVGGFSTWRRRLS